MPNTPTIREETEAIERRVLRGGASLACETRGRARPEEECPIRTCWQRDRDRILHCMAFRRLKHKTQVFLAPQGDHYTTRLTHTLEVSQIARTIARALRLNEDLTEAIALGHDLGHTPFGHSGERMLDELSGGFRHYEQSVRVVDRLERGGAGLNLTWEVRDGIERHTDGPQPATPEGRIVRLCDRIAYICHDIEDAKRAGVLSEEDLPREAVAVLGGRKSTRITTLVTNIVENGMACSLSGEVAEAFDLLHGYMYDTIYLAPVSKDQEKKAQAMIAYFWNSFRSDPSRMPDEYLGIMAKEGVNRAVCDYISGMTDTYAIWLFEELFVPRLYVPPAKKSAPASAPVQEWD